MDHVGLVLGLELDRLSRSCKDWHHLLEVCAIFGTMLADRDALYDPNDMTDRLVLGLRETMSAIELCTIRNRLQRARLYKVERGELTFDVSCGYVKLPTGGVAFDLDEQARGRVQLAFDKFDKFGSTGRLYRYLLRNKIRLGTRVHQGPSRGQLEWRRPTRAMLDRKLHHSIYEGAYSFGNRRVDHKQTVRNDSKVKMRAVPMSEWMVLQTGSTAGLHHL